MKTNLKKRLGAGLLALALTVGLLPVITPEAGAATLADATAGTYEGITLPVTGTLQFTDAKMATVEKIFATNKEGTSFRFGDEGGGRTDDRTILPIGNWSATGWTNSGYSYKPGYKTNNYLLVFAAGAMYDAFGSSNSLAWDDYSSGLINAQPYYTSPTKFAGGGVPVTGGSSTISFACNDEDYKGSTKNDDYYLLYVIDGDNITKAIYSIWNYQGRVGLYFTDSPVESRYLSTNFASLLDTTHGSQNLMLVPASWSFDTYRLYVNVNYGTLEGFSGSGTMARQYSTHQWTASGSPTVMAPGAPTRKGYTFLGWEVTTNETRSAKPSAIVTNQDDKTQTTTGTGTLIPANGEVTSDLRGDITLTAQWRQNYNVTYQNGGYGTAPNPAFGDEGDAPNGDRSTNTFTAGRMRSSDQALTFAQFEESVGHDFMYWKPLNDSSVMSKDGTALTTSAQVRPETELYATDPAGALVAQWIPRYTVTYDWGTQNGILDAVPQDNTSYPTLWANGGDGSVGNGHDYASCTVSGVGKNTVVGSKVFTGWKSSVDGAVYEPGYAFAVKANTTLTAQWIDGWLIKFTDTKGATNMPPSVGVKKDEAYLIPDTVPTYDEFHKFAGWFNELDGKLYQPGELIESVTANTTLRAVWNATNTTNAESETQPFGPRAATQHNQYLKVKVNINGTPAPDGTVLRLQKDGASTSAYATAEQVDHVFTIRNSYTEGTDDETAYTLMVDGFKTDKKVKLCASTVTETEAGNDANLVTVNLYDAKVQVRKDDNPWTDANVSLSDGANSYSLTTDAKNPGLYTIRLTDSAVKDGDSFKALTVLVNGEDTGVTLQANGTNVANVNYYTFTATAKVDNADVTADVPVVLKKADDSSKNIGLTRQVKTTANGKEVTYTTTQLASTDQWKLYVNSFDSGKTTVFRSGKANRTADAKFFTVSYQKGTATATNDDGTTEDKTPTGSVPTDGHWYLAGQTATAQTPGTLACEGFTFLNWKNTTDGDANKDKTIAAGTAQYEDGTPFTVSGTTVLTAQWKEYGRAYYWLELYEEKLDGSGYTKISTSDPVNEPDKVPETRYSVKGTNSEQTKSLPVPAPNTGFSLNTENEVMMRSLAVDASSPSGYKANFTIPAIDSATGSLPQEEFPIRIYYKRNSHKLTYHDSSASGSEYGGGMSYSVPYGADLTTYLPKANGTEPENSKLPALERKGYTYVWNYSSLTAGADGTYTMPDENVTLTANWTKNKITVRFDLNDPGTNTVSWGSHDLGNLTVEQDYDSPLAVTPNPTSTYQVSYQYADENGVLKDGEKAAEFLGWTVEGVENGCTPMYSTTSGTAGFAEIQENNVDKGTSGVWLKDLRVTSGTVTLTARWSTDATKLPTATIHYLVEKETDQNKDTYGQPFGTVDTKTEKVYTKGRASGATVTASGTYGVKGWVRVTVDNDTDQNVNGYYDASGNVVTDLAQAKLLSSAATFAPTWTGELTEGAHYYYMAVKFDQWAFDYNNDRKINAYDLAIFQRCIKSVTYCNSHPDHFKLSDVNQDGKVNAFDFAYLKRCLKDARVHYYPGNPPVQAD